ncbi:MAG: radical SAM protein [Desulfobacterales bacterium]
MRLKKVGIDIVHGCQLRCIGCPNSTLKPKIQYCDPADLEKMLNNIDAKVEIFRFYNFGESMLHPQLDEMVRIVGKSHLKPKQVEITTNGQYWNYSIFEKTFRQDIITHLYISCDGDGSKEEYERLKPPAKWDTLVWFMKDMRELRDKVCKNMYLGTRTITEDKYKKTWNVLKYMGYTPEFRKWSTRTDTENAPWKARKVPNGLCKFVRNNDSLYVDFDGTVVPCCIHPRAGVYGNLLERKASYILKDRFNFLDRMLDGRRKMDICGKCTKS